MGEEINITYESLMDFLRNERKKPGIQKIPSDFYEILQEYLKEKKLSLEEQSKESSIFGEDKIKSLETQLSNIKKIILFLIEKREKKIIELAINKAIVNSKVSDEDNLLSFEKVFYNNLVSIFKEYRGGVIENLLKLKSVSYAPKLKSFQDNKTQEEEKPQIKKVSVKFLQEVPEFIDSNSNKYGPFKEKQIGLIPENIAKVLISKKRATYTE